MEDFITFDNRSEEKWYTASVTGKESQTVTIPLDFPGEGGLLTDDDLRRRL